jgi:hypothetical protein
VNGKGCAINTLPAVALDRFVKDKWLEINSMNRADSLKNDWCSDRIATPYFKHSRLALQHLGNEFVAGQEKTHMTRIMPPDVAGPRPHRGRAQASKIFDLGLVLRLLGFGS